MKTIVCLFAILLLTTAAWSDAPADVAALVDREAGALVREGRLVSVAVGVVRDGETQPFFFGETERGNGRLPDDRTVYEIGSITKTMTAALLAQRVAAGELTLSDPVEGLMPDDITLPTFKEQAITLGDLASHVSGLPRLPANMGDNPADPYADYTMTDLKSFLAGYTLSAAPGTHFEYSNLGGAILGIALAHDAHDSYETLLTKSILAPLGMKDTTVTLSDDQQSRKAAPYMGMDASTRPTPCTSWNFGIFAPAGGVRSTLHDMLIYLKAHMSPEGTVLESAAPLLFEKRHDVAANVDIGLAWHMIDRADAPDIIWHSGGTGGYTAFTGFCPSKQTGLVLLTNTLALEAVDNAALNILIGL